MKNKAKPPEIVVPKGYAIDEILDMTDDFEDEEPIMRELQGWAANDTPVSAITGKSYNGINRLSLMQAASAR